MRTKLLPTLFVSVLLLGACAPLEQARDLVLPPTRTPRPDMGFAGENGQPIVVETAAADAVAVPATPPSVAAVLATQEAIARESPELVPTLDSATLAAATPDPVATPAGVSRNASVTKCPYRLPSTYREGRNIDCFFVTVPQRHAEPQGRQIRLMVVRLKSRARAPLEPVMYLSGGPGAGGISEGFSLLRTAFTDVLGSRDVVFVDQRGTGRSQPALICGEAYDLSINVTGGSRDAQRANRYADAMRTCAARLRADGADLAAYNTVENAADLNQIRQALGYEKVTLWGVSYGTTLALEAIRQFGPSIQSVILEGVAPPSVNLLEERAFTLDHAFGALFDGCTRDPACRDQYPDLERRFYASVTRLNERPISVESGVSSNQIRITGDDLIALIFKAQYDAELVEVLPQMIDQVNNGDYGQLTLVYRFAELTGSDIAGGMHYSVICAEEAQATDASRIQAGYRLFPRLAALNSGETTSIYTTLCPAWAKASLPATYDDPVVSDVPTLILNGAYDPITPPPWGALVAQTLPRATNLTFPAGSHGVAVQGNRCALQIVRSFLKDADVAPDSSCLAREKPVTFLVAGR
jgi:pimeloyl-ACP methyl ester carboxylesterase